DVEIAVGAPDIDHRSVANALLEQDRERASICSKLKIGHEDPCSANRRQPLNRRVGISSKSFSPNFAAHAARTIPTQAIERVAVRSPKSGSPSQDFQTQVGSPNIRQLSRRARAPLLGHRHVSPRGLMLTATAPPFSDEGLSTNSRLAMKRCR